MSDLLWAVSLHVLELLGSGVRYHFYLHQLQISIIVYT